MAAFSQRGYYPESLSKPNQDAFFVGTDVGYLSGTGNFLLPVVGKART